VGHDLPGLPDRPADAEAAEDVVQPQLERALGFLIRKPAPAISSTKSISEPLSRTAETESTTAAAPSHSRTASSASGVSIRSNWYWKPEQPPPSTATRRITGRPSSAESWWIRFAADGVRTIVSLMASPI
jgi:hypothetical protein